MSISLCMGDNLEVQSGVDSCPGLLLCDRLPLGALEDFIEDFLEEERGGEDESGDEEGGGAGPAVAPVVADVEWYMK